MQQNIIAATGRINEMNNVKYFFQSPLFFMLIVVFLVWLIIIRPIMKNNKERDEEIKKSGGVVSDDEHGWAWKTCRWRTMLFTFLSIAIITGGIHSDYFIEAFCSSLVALLAQLVASLLLPSAIRIISNKQHGILASSLVAVISFVLMCIAIIALKIHQQGFLVETAKIMCVCTSYKIMRSVAGFSSVFGSINKENQNVESAAIVEKPIDKEVSVRADGNIDGEIKFDVKTVATIIVSIVVTLLIIIVATSK